MDLEQYKKRLQKSMGLMCVLALLPLALLLTLRLWAPNVADESFAGFVAGMCSGLVGGILALLFKRGRAMRDEKTLRAMYIKDYDERNIAIKAKAGMPMVPLLAYLTMVAAVIAWPFNHTVFITLLIVGWVQLLTSAAVKLICHKIM